jgi:hypothetical protein
MELIKDPSHKANTTEKAVERFVNGSMGFRPGNDNPEASFYAQKIYDLVNTDPMASTNHEYCLCLMQTVPLYGSASLE